MTLFMETTQISAERTVGQIQEILAKHGANAVMMEYQNSAVSAVAFRFSIEGTGDIPFRLPCRWQSVAEILRKRAKISDYSWNDEWESSRKRRLDIEEKARRVAWRQILRWVEAQMALVETSMVKVEEVFLPYLQVNSTQTVFDKFKESGFAALEYKP